MSDDLLDQSELARRKRNRGYLVLFLSTAVVAIALLILRSVMGDM